MKLDAIDLRILDILQKNARLSNQDLADKMALSPSACLRRVRMLEERGFILGYHAKLDAAKLGFDVEVLLQVKVDTPEEGGHRNFEKALQSFDEVTVAYIISGPHDYILHVRTNTLHDFWRFMSEKLWRIPGIRDVNSNIVISRCKNECERSPMMRAAE